MSAERFAEYTRDLGVEPLDPAFTAAHLSELLRGGRQAIKKVLMDQRVLAGVGNIYANEALWRARHRSVARRGSRDAATRRARCATPSSACSTDRSRTAARAFATIATRSGGRGGFVEHLAVYGRAGEAVPALRRAADRHARHRRTHHGAMRALSKVALLRPPTSDEQLAVMRAHVRDDAARPARRLPHDRRRRRGRVRRQVEARSLAAAELLPLRVPRGQGRAHPARRRAHRVGVHAERVRGAARGAAADQALSPAVQRRDEARRPELLLHQDHARRRAEARRRARPGAGRLGDLLRSVRGRDGRRRGGARAERRARAARLLVRSADELRRSAGAVRHLSAHARLHSVRGQEVSRPVRRRLHGASSTTSASASRARSSTAPTTGRSNTFAARWKRRASASSTSAPRRCATSSNVSRRCAGSSRDCASPSKRCRSSTPCPGTTATIASISFAAAACAPRSRCRRRRRTRSALYGLIDDVFTPAERRRDRSRRTRSTSCCCSPLGSVASRGARANERGKAGKPSRRSPPRRARCTSSLADRTPVAPWLAWHLARLLHYRRARALTRERPLRSTDGTISWQPTTLVQCVSTRPWLVYPGCDEPGGCHDLTLGKIYEMLGVEGRGSFYRIIDDSGEDFLYPISHFYAV